jgi:hypothetical protein
VAGRLGEALAAGGGVEEAGEGLGQPLAVLGVGDEATPVLGDAPEAAYRLTGSRDRISTIRSSVRRVAGFLLFLFLEPAAMAATGCGCLCESL